MVTFSSPNPSRMRKSPDGSFMMKVMSNVATADVASPITSPIVRSGYAGGKLIFAIALVSGVKATSFSATIQGRFDDTCPWIDLIELTTTLSPTASFEFWRSNQSIAAGSQIGIDMVWPEMQVSFDSITGGTDPIYDVWIGGHPNGGA